MRYTNRRILYFTFHIDYWLVWNSLNIPHMCTTGNRQTYRHRFKASYPVVSTHCMGLNNYSKSGLLPVWQFSVLNGCFVTAALKTEMTLHSVKFCTVADNEQKIYNVNYCLKPATHFTETGTRNLQEKFNTSSSQFLAPEKWQHNIHKWSFLNEVYQFTNFIIVPLHHKITK